MFKMIIEKGEESYTIIQVKDPKLPIWFEKEDGEGMGLTEADFFEMLDKAFKENF